MTNRIGNSPAELPSSSGRSLKESRKDIDEWIARFEAHEKSGDISTRDQIRALVGRQASEGWSIAQLAKEIRTLGGIESRKRAVVIARTETASAYSRGSLLAYQESGVVEKVEWLATIDDATCPDCEGLHGTTAKLGKAFGDGTLFPPRHPNCRCSLAPVIE